MYDRIFGDETSPSLSRPRQKMQRSMQSRLPLWSTFGQKDYVIRNKQKKWTTATHATVCVPIRKLSLLFESQQSCVVLQCQSYAALGLPVSHRGWPAPSVNYLFYSPVWKHPGLYLEPDYRPECARRDARDDRLRVPLPDSQVHHHGHDQSPKTKVEDTPQASGSPRKHHRTQAFVKCTASIRSTKMQTHQLTGSPNTVYILSTQTTPGGPRFQRGPCRTPTGMTPTVTAKTTVTAQCFYITPL